MTSISIVHGQAPVEFGEPIYSPIPSPFGVGWTVALNDVDNDSHLDGLVCYDGGSILVYRGVGDGTFHSGQLYSMFEGPFHLTLADLNNDQFPDLITANVGRPTTATNISVWLNDGTGQFETPTKYSTGDRAPFYVLSVDLNDDGENDVVSLSYPTNLNVWLGNGDGTLGTRTNFYVGTGPDAVTAADFNSDGKIDLATACFTGNEVVLLQGNGDGSFISLTNINLPGYPEPKNSRPRHITTGDVNLDGFSDLVVATTSNGAVAVLLGHGDGTFTGPTYHPTAYNPRSVDIADFNGDGFPDLVAASFSTTNNVSVLLGNGSGEFSEPQIMSAASTYWVATGDLNHDGKTDIVTTAGRMQIAAFTNNTAPPLSIGNNLSPVISWPNWSNYVLQTSSDFTDWANEAESPVVNNGRKTLDLAPTENRRFYRLIK